MSDKVVHRDLDRLPLHYQLQCGHHQLIVKGIWGAGNKPVVSRTVTFWLLWYGTQKDGGLGPAALTLPPGSHPPSRRTRPHRGNWGIPVASDSWWVWFPDVKRIAATAKDLLTQSGWEREEEGDREGGGGKRPTPKRDQVGLRPKRAGWGGCRIDSMAAVQDFSGRGSQYNFQIRHGLAQ